MKTWEELSADDRETYGLVLKLYGCPDEDLEEATKQYWTAYCAVADALVAIEPKLPVLIAIAALTQIVGKQVKRLTNPPEVLQSVFVHLGITSGSKVEVSSEPVTTAPPREVGVVEGRRREPPAPGTPTPTRGRRWRS